VRFAGLGGGGSTVSAAVGSGVPVVGAGPRGGLDSVGTRSSGGAGVLGGGGGGRVGSDGPIAVEVPCGGPITLLSRRCALEHAAPNAMISEPTIAETVVGRFM
jgi:hypothetical protein